MITSRHIAEQFERLIAEQLRFAKEHVADDYYTDLLTGRNVGQDELAAVKLARTARADSAAFASPEDYATHLIGKLMELKQSYDRIYEDFDGYGAATFWKIGRDLTEYLYEAGITPARNPFRDPEQEDSPACWRNGLSASTQKAGIDYFEFERQLEDSAFFLQFALKQEEYLLAFDFAQIHLLQLATRLYHAMPTISTAETLLFCHRIRRIQSILVEVIYRARLPRIIGVIIYRYIAAAGSLLTFIERARSAWPDVAARPSESKLPCSLLGLNPERAERRYSKPQTEIAEYDDVVPHAMGDRLLTDLHEMLDEPCVDFLHRMFASPEAVLGGMPEGYTVLHYVVADTFQNDGWTIATNSAQLYCFALQPRFSDLRLSTTQIGDYSEVAEVVNRLAEASTHAITFGGDHSGGDLESDRRWLSHRLLLTVEKECLSGSEGIAVVAEGIMATVPYAGLEAASGRMLIEDYDLVFAGGLRSLSKHWRVTFHEVERGTVVGSPEYDHASGAPDTCHGSVNQGRFRPIPRAKAECEAVARITHWKLVCERDATAGAVSKLLSAAQAVHLVTHGVYDGLVTETKLAEAIREPDEFFAYEQKVISGAKIAFAGANAVADAHTNMISAADIASIDVSQLRLAFLSLCVGSVGATVTGENLFGLARSFLAGGTTCVVASLFPVEDGIGEQIAIAFYQELAKGERLTVERCLKSAQLRMAMDGAPWYKWAGYQALV